MGDPINDDFIKMCERKIPDRMMATEFAINFQRLLPQFSSKTRIEDRSLSDSKVLLTETADYLREPEFIWVKKSGLKALLYRVLGVLLQQPALKGQGYNFKRSPYASYPRRYAVKVQSAQYMWRAVPHEFTHGISSIWHPQDGIGDLIALARVYFAYDPWRDTLYIDFEREWIR